MSSFTTPLIVTPLSGRKWRLVHPFTYEVGFKDSGMKIRVPEGFVTDFASVPRIFWGIFPPWGRYGKAAVIHDYLYATHLYDRKRSDNIFLEAMKVLGVSWWKRKIIYRSVRLGGRRAWKKGDKK